VDRFSAGPRSTLQQNSDPMSAESADFVTMLSLRLRYEVVRKFAPYIGVSYNKKIGSTATLASANDGRTDALQFAFGLRMWL
jgi:uncharacterized protein involved in copper resistance